MRTTIPAMVKFLKPEEGGRTTALEVRQYAGMCVINQRMHGVGLRFEYPPPLGRLVPAMVTFDNVVPTDDFDLLEGKQVVARVMLVPDGGKEKL